MGGGVGKGREGRGKGRTFWFSGLRETEASLYRFICISMPYGIKSSQAKQNMCTLSRLLRTSFMFNKSITYSVLYNAAHS